MLHNYRDKFRAIRLLLWGKMFWLDEPKDIKNAEREVQLDPFRGSVSGRMEDSVSGRMEDFGCGPT